MTFDLEESVEDALCAYLRTGMPGDVRIYPSLTAMEGVQFPYVGVEAGESSNVSDDGNFSGRRRVSVMVGLVMEAIPLVDAVNQITKTVRDRNRDLRAALWGLLAHTDLHTDVNAALGWTFNESTKLWTGGAARVLFSKIMPMDSARSIEGQEITTAITLDTIAQPTE